jgi:hypothetical protein
MFTWLSQSTYKLLGNCMISWDVIINIDQWIALTIQLPDKLSSQ